jgi:hypothetical protein
MSTSRTALLTFRKKDMAHQPTGPLTPAQENQSM